MVKTFHNGIIRPIDELIFSRWLKQNRQPVSDLLSIYYCIDHTDVIRCF